MQDLYKKPREMSFQEVLDTLQCDESEYITAIRSSLKINKVFLRRSSWAVGINAYNKDILQQFESNMDIQFVLDEYSIAAYMMKYITKADDSVSKFII